MFVQLIVWGKQAIHLIPTPPYHLLGMTFQTSVLGKN